MPLLTQRTTYGQPRRNIPNTKPPIGVRVDRRHPFGRALMWCIPCHEGAGLPSELVTGQPLYFGGTSAGNGTGPAPSSQTNTPPVWVNAKNGAFWRGVGLDCFPGGATCTPIVFGNAYVGGRLLPQASMLPRAGFSTAWLFNPANTTSGNTRVGDTENGNPFGFYVNQAGAGKITVTAYDFANATHVVNASFTVAEDWILLVETWRAGLASWWANLDGSGNRTSDMRVFLTYGTGDPTTSTNTDPITTWQHTGVVTGALGITGAHQGTFSPNGSYDTTNHLWFPVTTQYQGLFGATWGWWDFQFDLASANAFKRDMWGMLT